jgi:hypothetical protein
MLRPTRSSPSAAYWGRRLLLAGAVLLVALTGYVVFAAGDGSKRAAGDHYSGRSNPQATAPDAVPCVPSVLSIAALTAQKNYRIGQQPELEIQVTNTGESPCVSDLSDGQIELLVYNGESRVWSSHDCRMWPGQRPLTLAPRQVVRRSIRWTGLSSQPHCAGSRQRIGAGIYTLHARLGQTDGRPTTFSIS